MNFKMKKLNKKFKKKANKTPKSLSHLGIFLSCFLGLIAICEAIPEEEKSQKFPGSLAVDVTGHMKSGVELPSPSTLLFAAAWVAICIFGWIEPVGASDHGQEPLQESEAPGEEVEPPEQEVEVEEPVEEEGGSGGNETLADATVEQLSSILDQPDDPEEPEELEGHNESSPLVVDKNAPNEPLLMITWHRYVVIFEF